MGMAATTARSQDSTNQIKSAADIGREQARPRRQTQAKGTLEDIDYLRHELKLKMASGLRTFTYTPRTYIFRDKDKITLDKLKIGEVIALQYRTGDDGIRTVVRIKAYGAPTAAGPPPGPSSSTNQLPNTLP